MIPKVISMHSEEAGELLTRRTHDVGHSQFAITDLEFLDSRMDAHLDGLLIGCQAQGEFAKLWRDAADQGVGRRAICAVAVRQGKILPDLLDTNYDELAKLEDPVSVLTDALEWAPYELAESQIAACLKSDRHEFRQAAVLAIARHRVNADAHLKLAREDDNENVRAAAFRCDGAMGIQEFESLHWNAIKAESGTTRFWAAWAMSLMTRDPIATGILCHYVDVAEEDIAILALQVAVPALAPSNTQKWIEGMLADAATRRLGISAAGIHGVSKNVDAILAMMKVPEFARVAGESFNMLTGLDLTEDPFEAEAQQDPDADHEPAEPAIEARDASLPIPNVKEVENWWDEKKAQFEPGTRYLLGKPITEDWMIEVLHHGYQRQRARAAIELALLRPGSVLFNVAAPAWRQKKWLAELR